MVNSSDVLEIDTNTGNIVAESVYAEFYAILQDYGDYFYLMVEDSTTGAGYLKTTFGIDGSIVPSYESPPCAEIDWMFIVWARNKIVGFHALGQEEDEIGFKANDIVVFRHDQDTPPRQFIVNNPIGASRVPGYMLITSLDEFGVEMYAGEDEVIYYSHDYENPDESDFSSVSALYQDAWNDYLNGELPMATQTTQELFNTLWGIRGECIKSMHRNDRNMLLVALSLQQYFAEANPKQPLLTLEDCLGLTIEAEDDHTTDGWAEILPQFEGATTIERLTLIQILGNFAAGGAS